MHGARWVLEISGGTLHSCEVYDCLTTAVYLKPIQNNTESRPLLKVFLIQKNIKGKKSPVKCTFFHF